MVSGADPSVEIELSHAFLRQALYLPSPVDLRFALANNFILTLD